MGTDIEMLKWQKEQNLWKEIFYNESIDNQWKSQSEW